MSIEIDFNETSQDYYLGIAYQLKQSIPKQWPEDPTEAFELLKEYHAKYQMVGHILSFLRNFHFWNQKAMEQELGKISQFISEAEELNIEQAFYDHTQPTDFYELSNFKKIYYIRIKNNYYNYNHVQHDEEIVTSVFSRYILLKEVLEERLKIEQEKQNELQNQGNKVIPDFSKALEAFSHYISGITANEFKNIVEYHTTISGKRAKWIGKQVDGTRFALHISMTLSNWNKCFELKNGKKLRHSNKNENSESEIDQILKKYLPRK